MLTQPEWVGLQRAVKRAVVIAPLLGAAVVGLSSRSEGLYRLLVREDAILEWSQVAAYGAAVTIAVITVRKHRRDADLRSVMMVGTLAVVSFVAVGEELSWGQRILGFETPGVAAANRQGELTLHNDARVEHPARLALLVAALYGTVAPLVVRRITPLVPPRALVGFFAVVVAYMTVRLALLEHPSYPQAKYSEWPETCFAIALCAWCASISASIDPSSRRMSRTANNPHGSDSGLATAGGRVAYRHPPTGRDPAERCIDASPGG